MRLELKRYLESGSSPIDWCEPNYEKSPKIAEFYNVFSNFIYFLGPPVLIYLHREYAKRISPAINVIWLFYMVVGGLSMYYHATLSLFGQLMDEIAILWTFLIAFACLCPQRYRPGPLKRNRNAFIGCTAVAGILLSILSFYQPVANAIVLLTFTVPLFIASWKFLRRERVQRANDLILRTLIMLAISVLIWVNDRFFCDIWIELKFPYLHAVWHILIFVASYAMCVFSAWAYALDEAPEWKPRIAYWPNDKFELGIPYVSLKTPDHLI